MITVDKSNEIFNAHLMTFIVFQWVSLWWNVNAHHFWLSDSLKTCDSIQTNFVLNFSLENFKLLFLCIDQALWTEWMIVLPNKRLIASLFRWLRKQFLNAIFLERFVENKNVAVKCLKKIHWHSSTKRVVPVIKHLTGNTRSNQMESVHRSKFDVRIVCHIDINVKYGQSLVPVSSAPSRTVKMFDFALGQNYTCLAFKCTLFNRQCHNKYEFKIF